MKKLRIGQISPLNLPIPPKKYGGTEKIIYWLCNGLTEKGHEVFLFGTKNCKTKAKLIPIIPKGLWQMKNIDSTPFYAYAMAMIAKKAKQLKLDILHDHLGPHSLSLYGQTDIPIVHTLHVPMDNSRAWAYRKLNARLVSISNAQRKPAPDLNYAATIYNGIDIKNFPFNDRPGDHFIWGGELSQRKGILEVIKIAKLAKIKLILVGRIPPPTQKKDHLFFKKYIKRKLNKNGIRYVGEVERGKLGRYYRNARAFLYPLQWEEPFGLMIIEAIACGTPVIAFRRGSVPEVVKNNKTGLVVSPFSKKGKPNIEGFMQAMKKIDQIDRRECRRWVEENFTIEKMTGEYEKLFYKILRD